MGVTQQNIFVASVSAPGVKNITSRNILLASSLEIEQDFIQTKLLTWTLDVAYTYYTDKFASLSSIWFSTLFPSANTDYIGVGSTGARGAVAPLDFCLAESLESSWSEVKV